MPAKYQCKHRGHICRSVNEARVAGEYHPLRMLCSAVIAQAAVDCDLIGMYGEEEILNSASKSAVSPKAEMTVAALERFICSDWLDFLLSWQDEFSADSVAEKLWKRLHP